MPRIDVEAANHLCATWEKAPFCANMMLHRLTPAGRIGVFNTRVSEVRDGVKTVRDLRDAIDLAQLFAADLGLQVSAEDVELVAAKPGLPMAEARRSAG